MSNYIIEGGRKLEGEVKVSGSKNASLPILAATILSGKTTTLYNVPNIKDVNITIKMLELLGCKVKKMNNKLVIDSSNVKAKTIPEELMRELRSSVILAGAILGRFNEATFSYPGGCDIGSRPIDLHLTSFKKLGINIEENAGYIICKCDKIKGNKIHLDFPSVGATENIILATVLADGVTVIENAAREPEIVDLVNILKRMGAKILGEGTNIIQIEGVKSLKNVSYNIMPDRIEAGTLLVATAITYGNVKVTNMCVEHIKPVLYKLEECKCKVIEEKNSVIIEPAKRLIATEIKTLPYPGFPTDMQSIFAGMLTIAKGTSVVTENIFENRYKYMNELKRMGAKVTIEGKVAIIKGIRKLTGANVEATDLRGGATLVLAGLAAKGKTKVNKIEYILRGYDGLDKKLSSLGAKIVLEEGDKF